MTVSRVRLTGLMIQLTGLAGISSDKTVSETTSATVPGTAVTGYGQGVLLHFPAPLLDGYLPSSCAVQSSS